MPANFPLSDPPLDSASQQQLIEGLVTRGWAQQAWFLPEQLTRSLATECLTLMGAGVLKPAAVGHGITQTVQPTIRSDGIYWLKAGQSLACDAYLARMETLRVMLNQQLYLGLDDYESHFALYAPGASYQQHLDRFRDDDCRTVSALVYLNQDWLESDGGMLRLHPLGQAVHDIAPIGGSLVLFLSAEIPHEVLPATRNRLSLAGWFRRRS